MSGEDSRLRGRWGEALAAEFLRRKGYRVVAAGRRGRFGELGPGAGRGGVPCVVRGEPVGGARVRAGRRRGDRRKRERLRTTAELYLQQHPSPLQPRFDVVEILAPQGMATKRPGIRQIENAFSGAE